jgi:hypothetical protein
MGLGGMGGGVRGEDVMMNGLLSGVRLNGLQGS